MLANDRDTKRPYDEAQLCAGLLTYGVKAYSNAAVRMSTNAEAYSNAEASECKPSCPIPEHLQTASAIIEHVIPCETLTTIASANVNSRSTSSQRERIELVALPTQHVEPCATQLQTASALSHTPPCATPVQTASATRPEPPPRSFKSKKITDYGYQTKNIAKNMANSSVENARKMYPHRVRTIQRLSL